MSGPDITQESSEQVIAPDIRENDNPNNDQIQTTEKAVIPGTGEENAIRRWLKTATEAQIVEKLLDSGRDPLTGLLNRRGLSEEAERLWDRLLENKRRVSEMGPEDQKRLEFSRLVGVRSTQILCMDLSGFRAYNNAKGEGEGDKVLKRIGRGLVMLYGRETDIQCRWGGDELVILSLNSPTSENGAREMQEKINSFLPESVRSYMVYKGFKGQVNPEAKINEVMKQMDEAKKKGAVDESGRNIGGGFVYLGNEP